MQRKRPPQNVDERLPEIANLIRDSYADLRQLLNSPYVDGHQLHRCLTHLGHDMTGYGPDIVSETLGWKCMGLPVANIDGIPKHYLPSAAPKESPVTCCVSEQTEAFVRNLHEFEQTN